MEFDMQDNNWNFNINLNGVAAAGFRPPVVEGYYNGTISEAYVDPTRNENRVVFKVVFTDPGFQGVVRSGSLMKPGSTQKDNRVFWRALLESCGYTAAQLDQNLALQAAHVVGRPCKVHFKPKDENALDDKSRYDQLNFLSPKDWDTRKATFESRKATQTVTTHGTVATKAAIPAQSQGLGNVSTPSLGTVPSNGAPQPTASFAAPSMSAADLRAMVQNNN